MIPTQSWTIDGENPWGLHLLVSMRWSLPSEQYIRYTRSRAQQRYSWSGCPSGSSNPVTQTQRRHNRFQTCHLTCSHSFFLHSQLPGSRISTQTNATGLSTFRKTIKQYAIHMHSLRDVRFPLAAQSAPYWSGVIERSFQVLWAPRQQSIRVQNLRRALTFLRRETSSTEHAAISPTTKLWLLLIWKWPLVLTWMY